MTVLVRVTDWLVPNETEFALLSGSTLDADPARESDQIAAFARELGVSLVVTLGERGAALSDRGGQVERVASPMVTAVDTTGAGDAFVGGFAVGLALGWTAAAAAALGCAVAADSVTRPGTQRAYADHASAATILASAAP